MNESKEYVVSLYCDCREDLPMIDRQARLKFASVQSRIETTLIKEMFRKAFAVHLAFGEYNILEEIAGTIAVPAYLRIECSERVADIMQRYYPLTFYATQEDRVDFLPLK